MTDRLVVIGGDAGGMSAAAQARRLRPDLEIVVFERGEFTSYAACGLPYFVGGEVTDRDRLVARTPEEFRTRGIDVRTRHEVTAVDTAARTVEGVLDDAGHEPTAWLVSYGDSAVNYELVVWADRRLTTSPGGTHAKLMWALDDALAERGIEIPFPQRDLHVKSGALEVRLTNN